MIRFLEYLAAASLWLVVGSVIVYIDPMTIRDVLIPGLYLPLLVITWLALAYSISLLISRVRYVLGITTFLTVFLAIFLAF